MRPFVEKLEPLKGEKLNLRRFLACLRQTVALAHPNDGAKAKLTSAMIEKFDNLAFGDQKVK